MAYTKLGIINLALTRIGVKRLSSLTENTTQCEDALAVYDTIRDLVLEEEDWTFAKVRATLGTGGEALDESYHYAYAYQLPPNFLRLVSSTTDPNGTTDPPVYPPGYPYIVETIAVIGEDDQPYDIKCLLIDYDNSDNGLFINYIKRQEDVTQYTGNFVNAFAFRLAAELCINRTEGMQKYGAMMELYKDSLVDAKAHNRSMDYQKEVANKNWINAGRS